jgi:hypothetical protein
VLVIFERLLEFSPAIAVKRSDALTIAERFFDRTENAISRR